MDVLWLGDPACSDVARVGGKAANLSDLFADYCVPAGFCVTSDAFARSSATGGALSGLPPDLVEEVTMAYATLAVQWGVAIPAVCVRSSAVDEDGLVSSSAGQYETLLNVVGADQVVQAVAHCWASARSERVMAYRREQGIPRDGFRLAVLVQQLVRADVSAVAFSANPITRDRDQIVITASWGLGESIVGGTVTPDTYLVCKSDLAVLNQAIGEKRRMTVLADHGTREVDVPRILRDRAVLDDVQVSEIAALARNLDERVGRPVDVECAYDGHRLYLFQCRPITTLGNRNDPILPSV